MTDDRRRVAAVTGGTGAIGEAIARGIAQDLNYEVILVCRNASKAERACSNISTVTGNPRVRYEVVDLSQRSSIQSLSKRWLGPLHVLVNNAADTPRRNPLPYNCVCRLAWVSPGAQEPRRRLSDDNLDRSSIPGVVRIYVQAVTPALQFLTYRFVNAALQAYHRGEMFKGGEGRREAV